MNEVSLELVEAGPATSLQDLGRRGWKRYGIPKGGALDDHAARWANRLLGNCLSAPVLEFGLQTIGLRALQRVAVALTGAAASGSDRHWRAWVMEQGEVLDISPPPIGMWSYLGILGGFVGPRWFGSVSIVPEAGIGQELKSGDLLHRTAGAGLSWPVSVGQRWLDPLEQRQFMEPPPLPVWTGHLWQTLSATTRQGFLDAAWRVDDRCDRRAYRLSGPPLPAGETRVPMEPVMPGTLQITTDGKLLVAMQDAPVLSDLPIIGLIDPDHLSRLAQCRAGQEIRFTQATTITGTQDGKSAGAA